MDGWLLKTTLTLKKKFFMKNYNFINMKVNFCIVRIRISN